MLHEQNSIICHFLSVFFFPALMMITGFFVNGPYALITTAVSADLVSKVLSFGEQQSTVWCIACSGSCVHAL